MKTLQAFVAAHGITMQAHWADSNPNVDADTWAAGASHWKCQFRSKAGRRMTVYFSQGPAISREPTARSFEDWASEYGYNADSRKDERTYNAVKAQSLKLRKFIGSEDALQELMFQTERR